MIDMIYVDRRRRPPSSDCSFSPENFQGSGSHVFKGVLTPFYPEISTGSRSLDHRYKKLHCFLSQDLWVVTTLGVGQYTLGPYAFHLT